MRLPRQLLVNCHRVIRLPSGSGEFLLQKVIKGPKIVHPPVLPGPYFAEIATQLHKADVPFPLRRLFPVQNLVDLL